MAKYDRLQRCVTLQEAGGLSLQRWMCTFCSMDCHTCQLKEPGAAASVPGTLWDAVDEQLVHSVVYWPLINSDIEHLCRTCTACTEHNNKLPKTAKHPRMLPEKPWSRLHLDHAISFLGTNLLVCMDAYLKYPCFHPTSSTSTKLMTDLLEEDFALFTSHCTLVTNNSTMFLSEEVQAWCHEWGITHLTGAPYHPTTNGAVKCLVRLSFKQCLRKSSLPTKGCCARISLAVSMHTTGFWLFTKWTLQ